MTASNDLLERLHALVGEKLVERIESGEASAQEFAQAIKFLKDNGIEAIPTGDTVLDRLEATVTSKLPFSDPEDPSVSH